MIFAMLNFDFKACDNCVCAVISMADENVDMLKQGVPQLAMGLGMLDSMPVSFQISSEIGLRTSFAEIFSCAEPFVKPILQGVKAQVTVEMPRAVLQFVVPLIC